MGIEGYTVTLIPVAEEGVVEGERPTVAHLSLLLVLNGFYRLSEGRKRRPAWMPAPPPAQFRYRFEEEETIIDLLLSWESPAAEQPVSLDYLLVSRVVLQFAICQSEQALQRFLEVVRFLAEEAGFQAQGPGEELYPLQNLTRFEQQARAQVACQREHWRRLFPGWRQDLALPVEQCWSWFLEHFVHSGDFKEEPDCVLQPIFTPPSEKK